MVRMQLNFAIRKNLNKSHLLFCRISKITHRVIEKQIDTGVSYKLAFFVCVSYEQRKQNKILMFCYRFLHCLEIPNNNFKKRWKLLVMFFCHGATFFILIYLLGPLHF